MPTIRARLPFLSNPGLSIWKLCRVYQSVQVLVQNARLYNFLYSQRNYDMYRYIKAGIS